MIALGLAGCSGVGGLLAPAPAETFDLRSASDTSARAGRGRGTLLVQEPNALRILDSDRIVVRPSPNEVTYLGGAQWSDRLPRLVQARLVETFQKASRLRTVARPGEGVDGDNTLLTEIRAFEIDAGAGSVARVEMTARVVGTRSGRVVAAEVFSATVPGSTEPRAAAAALDQALNQVLNRIVVWASRG
jgi:cholesterol transport system auxiliary component